MMRGPSNWAVAVRRPDGRISEVHHPIVSVAARRRWLRLPVIRGVVALGESLAIGFRALAVSGQYAATSEGEEDASTELGTGAIVVAFVIALAFSLVLFKASPALITYLFDVHGTFFVLLEGAIKVAILVGYLAAISLVPDLRRVFEYHAAEHKAINAYEAGDPLTPESVQRHSLIHVRCGTAFLLWVMLVSIFSFLPSGRLPLEWPIIPRILGSPRIAGLECEVIRVSVIAPHRPEVR